MSSTCRDKSASCNGMEGHVLLRLLLHIVLLLSLASCTLPARLQWNSSLSLSPSPSDHMPIERPSHSSDVNPSLNMTVGQIPSSCQTTNATLGSVQYEVTVASQTTNTTNPLPSVLSQERCVACPPHGNTNPSVSCEICNVSASPSSPPSATPFRSSSPSPSPSNYKSFAPASPSPSPFHNGYTSVAPTSPPLPSHSPPTIVDKTVPYAGASRGRLNLLGKIGIAITVLVVSLVLLIAVIKAFKKKKDGGTDIRSYTTGQLPNPAGNLLEEEGIDVRTYTKEELAGATDNFTTVIGQGVSGFVYRANLPGNRTGAVKRATDLDPKLFKQELSVLLRLPRHPHLVDLIGLCLQEGERILVFEFISNGSLHDRLHTERGLESPLSWTARMDIAYEVAVALQYLHEEANPPILHRDVKSANVLLGDDNRAKLADFGLSKLGPKDNQFTITAVRGSYGYMDPQYVRTRRYSAKSDVYSFGVLLLELITGLKSIHEDTPLAEWTEKYRFSEGIDIFTTIVDRNMKDHINTMELQTMIKIANLCLRDIGEERSSMRENVNMMQETRNRKANGNLSDGDGAHL